MASGDFFLPHSGMIWKIIVNSLIKPGYFPYKERDELFQQVNETLLMREEKITGSFQGKAKFSTYLAVVVTNICREIRNREIRARSRRASYVSHSSSVDQASLFKNLADPGLPPDARMIIRETVRKLDQILKTYPKNQKKMVFCLRALHRIPVSLSLLDCDMIEEPDGSTVEAHMGKLNTTNEKTTRSEIYSHLTCIYEVVERRKKSDDAIRKWLNDRVSEVIILLNGNPPISAFNKETFQYLFEYYCQMEESTSAELSGSPMKPIKAHRS